MRVKLEQESPNYSQSLAIDSSSGHAEPSLDTLLDQTFQSTFDQTPNVVDLVTDAHQSMKSLVEDSIDLSLNIAGLDIEPDQLLQRPLPQFSSLENAL